MIDVFSLVVPSASMDVMEPSLPDSVSSEGETDEMPISLPPSVCSEMMNSKSDSPRTPSDLPDEDGELRPDDLQGLDLPDDGLEDHLCKVPTPSEMEQLLHRCASRPKGPMGMELYSPPRVLPKATPGIAATSCWSFDIVNGWDFDLAARKALTLKLLKLTTVIFLYLSPPCTMFSELQRLFNYKRMTKEVFEARMKQAKGYVFHAMQAAVIQHNLKRHWMYEHPWKASSWQLLEVQHVRNMPGVYSVDFDMCSCGMVSPHGKPVKKRTRILTNSHCLACQLAERQCDRSHEHRPIEGSEGGYSMSTWCQRYPPGLVQLLAEAMHAEG